VSHAPLGALHTISIADDAFIALLRNALTIDLISSIHSTIFVLPPGVAQYRVERHNCLSSANTEAQPSKFNATNRTFAPSGSLIGYRPE
jgi:hypothetical protein